MKHYVKNQHYIPRFILRNFANINGKIGSCNITKLPFQWMDTTSEAICFEKNINEIVNLDGTYYKQNSVELLLATIEEKIAVQFHNMCSYIDTAENILPEDHIAIASFIALQATRNPFANRMLAKRLLETLSISEQEKEIYKKSLLIPQFLVREDLQQYLVNNGYALSKDALANIPRVSAYVETLNYLLWECIEYVIMPLDDGVFYCSDNVPLIGLYQDCKHLIPVSPRLAVCTCSPRVANFEHRKGIVRLGKAKIDSINSYIINNARRFVIYSPDNAEQAKQDILRYRLNTLNYPL